MKGIIILTLSILTAAHSFVLNAVNSSALTPHDFRQLLDLLMEERNLRRQLETQVSQLVLEVNNNKGIIDAFNQALNKEKSNRHQLEQSYTQVSTEFQNLSTEHHALMARNKELEAAFLNLTRVSQDRLNSVDMNIRDINRSTTVNWHKEIQAINKAVSNHFVEVESNISSLTNDVFRHQQQLATIDSDIKATHLSVSTNQAEVSANRAEITKNRDRITSALARISTNEADLSANRADITKNRVNLTSAMAKIATNQAELSENAADIATNRDNITSTLVKISANKAELSANRADIITNRDNITSAVSKISTNQAELSEIRTETTKNRANITSALAKISTNQAIIANIQAAVSQNHADLAANGRTISRNSADILSLKQKAGYQIGFSAAGNNVASGILKFHSIITNYGGGYSSSTGTFTCNHAGLYYFSLSLIKERANHSVADTAYCYIKKNSDSLIWTHTDPFDDDTDNGSYETSAFIVAHLSYGDTVYVGGCSASSSLDGYSSFSGFLLRAD